MTCSTRPETGILDFMDQYAKIDYATLVRNLNAVCRGLGNAMNRRGPYGAPPALTGSDLGDSIPLALYNVAVSAGWIEEQTELEESEYYRSKDADLFGGCMFLTASFQEWFLGLVADSMAELETMALENQSAQEKFQEHIWECESAWYKSKGLVAPKPPAEAENRAKKIIDEFYGGESFKLQALANLANAAGEKMMPPVVVSRVSVSRIYHGSGYVGPEIRGAVASVINVKVPCTRDDLYTPKRQKQQ